MSFLDLLGEPMVRVRFRTGWTIGRSDDGASFTTEGPAGKLPAIGRYVPEFEQANARLASGASLAALRNEVIAAAGASRAAGYLLWLQGLYRWGLIELPLVDEVGERAVVLPQWSWYTPRLAPEPPPPEVPLDRFACLRRDDGAWLLESPLAGARLSFDDLATLAAPVVRRFLAAAGFLAAPPETGDGDLRRAALAQWEFHDLIFHMHHRVGWHRDPMGALFPYIGRIEPLPAVRPAWPGERIALARAPSESGEPFASVLERRRSERVYDEDHPISLRDLGVLLDRAVRVRSSETVTIGDFAGRTADFEITRRPYPTGGASYELEVYPVVDRCDGLDSGLYHYDAGTHELVRIADRSPEMDAFFADTRTATAGLAAPQIVLAIAARYARVMWKYRSISYAVILRDTGVLYQTLYLAATELGLSPCGIGAGNAALFARMTGLDPVVEGTVGEFILGGRPRPS